MDALICLLREHTIKDKETQQDVSPKLSASATLFIIEMSVVYISLALLSFLRLVWVRAALALVYLCPLSLIQSGTRS